MKKESWLARYFWYSFTLKSETLSFISGKFWRFGLYFLMLNVIMFLPLTFSIYNLGPEASFLLGVNVRNEIPDWFAHELPADCEIVNQRLTCETEEVFSYTVNYQGEAFSVVVNVDDQETAYDQPASLVFHETYFTFQLPSERRFVLTYQNFPYLSFEALQEMEREAAYTLFFDALYESIRPFVIVPLMVILVGGYIVANALLILGLSGFALLFRLNDGQLPHYPQMVKLFILASTLPSVVNLGLGFLGLSAFTAIPYNFLTPLMAFVLYRRHQNALIS